MWKYQVAEVTGAGAAGGDGLNLHSIINLAIYAAPKTKKRQIKA